MLHQIFGLRPTGNQRVTQKTQTISATVTRLTNSKEMRAETEYLTVFFQEPGQAMENHDCKVEAKTQELFWLPRETTCYKIALYLSCNCLGNCFLIQKAQAANSNGKF